MVIKAIGFDFDGTLIMSEDRKALEMKKVFLEKFNIKDNVEKEYLRLSMKALPRDEKVKLLFKKYVKRTPTRKELKEVEKHFGQHYRQSLRTCPLFQCTNVIKELKDQVKFVFLLSLENKKEVVHVAQHCGLAKYFDEILGGPKLKTENLRHVLKKHHLKPTEVLYIGDAHSDVIASRKMRVKVILLGKNHTFERLKEDLEADFKFSDLCEIPHGIEGFTK